jgi:hypothetical protein
VKTAKLAFATAALAAVTIQANTYAGSDWILEYNVNGQIELSADLIDFESGTVLRSVTLEDIAGPDPGALCILDMPFVYSVPLYETDSNGSGILGDLGDRLRNMYGDDPGELPYMIDGADLAWMNPVLADYDLEVQLAVVTAEITAKNGERVYELRDGRGFILEGEAFAKDGTGREDGYLAASSKFFLTRAVPEPTPIAALAVGFSSVVAYRVRRRA